VKVKVVWRTSLQNQEVKFTFFVLHPSPLASHLFLIGPWILAIKNTMGLCLPFHFQAYCWFLLPWLLPLIFLFHFPKNTTRPRVAFVKSFSYFANHTTRPPRGKIGDLSSKAYFGKSLMHKVVSGIFLKKRLNPFYHTESKNSHDMV
jgi:hypothetical protein